MPSIQERRLQAQLRDMQARLPQAQLQAQMAEVQRDQVEATLRTTRQVFAQFVTEVEDLAVEAGATTIVERINTGRSGGGLPDRTLPEE